MKHLILLLALALPAAAQTLTNTNLDGVTNATINGKLDDDAAATRTALGLGTAATAANGTITSQAMAWNGSAWAAATNVGAVNFTAFQGVGGTLNMSKAGFQYLDGNTYNDAYIYFAPMTQTRNIAFPDKTGTVALTSDIDKNSVFYAKDYGVLADGTTNDTVALQACIDAASAVATPSARATVVLPSGLIRLGRTVQTGIGENKQAINLKSNVNLAGQGMGSTTLRLLDNVVADTPTLLAYGTTKTNSTTTNGSPTVTVSSTTQILVGMSATGTNIPSSTFVSAIVNGTTITLSKNATGTSSVVSIAFDHCNMRFSDFTIDGNAVVRGVDGGSEDEGLNFKQCDDVTVSQVRFYNCGQDGIDLDAGSDILIIGCEFDRNFGNGIHAFGGGPSRVRVIGCSFISNGFQRRALEPGTGGVGSGIDSITTELIIDGCIFRHNAVELQIVNGHATVTNTQITHGDPGGPTGALTTTLSAIIAGSTTGSAATDASLSISGCRIGVLVDSAIQAVNAFPLVQIVGNRIHGATTITSAARVIFSSNYQTGTYGVHLVATSKPAQICNNYFDVGYANGLRIEASTGGLASGNHFVGTDGGALDIAFRAGSTGWKIVGNNFSSATTGVVSLSGGGGTAKIFGNTGGFDLSLGAASSIIKNNELDAVALQSGGSTSNVFEGNTISGTITHTTATFASNTWRRNTGAGCLNVFYGTATLVSGTTGTPIATAAANSARKWSLSRQAPNASTAIGNLALGTVTAQTSFVINALNDTATTATGDLSSVYWEILE